MQKACHCKKPMAIIQDKKENETYLNLIQSPIKQVFLYKKLKLGMFHSLLHSNFTHLFCCTLSLFKSFSHTMLPHNTIK